jgi:hypothetical protein
MATEIQRFRAESLSPSETIDHQFSGSAQANSCHHYLNSIHPDPSYGKYITSVNRQYCFTYGSPTDFIFSTEIYNAGIER